MLKVCIFTATRAEWGLLHSLASVLKKQSGVQLTIIASGTHLSKAHGYTVDSMRADGFEPDACVDISVEEAATPLGTARVTGRATGLFSDALDQLKPDLLVILGDRYEALAAALAAHILGIPIAHIHGGEITEGAIDDAFRHCITKLAFLHFPAAEVYRQRIIQMGESPDRVFNVGSLGVDNIQRMQFWTAEELEERFNYSFDQPFLLVTFHPETMKRNSAKEDCEALFAALDAFPDLGVVFTGANSDAEGDVVNHLINVYCEKRGDSCVSFMSMGAQGYLSAMHLCSAVLGNSSSGVIEAPAVGVPTVNIGDRQMGRERAASVIDAPVEPDAIIDAIRQALSENFQLKAKSVAEALSENNAANQIASHIGNLDTASSRTKRFFDLSKEV